MFVNFHLEPRPRNGRAALRMENGVVILNLIVMLGTDFQILTATSATVDIEKCPTSAMLGNIVVMATFGGEVKNVLHDETPIPIMPHASVKIECRDDVGAFVRHSRFKKVVKVIMGDTEIVAYGVSHESHSRDSPTKIKGNLRISEVPPQNLVGNIKALAGFGDNLVFCFNVHERRILKFAAIVKLISKSSKSSSPLECS